MGSFKLTEVKANLFHAPQTYSLAHAVSADFMSVKGSLAWQFSVIFGQVDELSQQQVEVGNVALLEDNTRFIYYLITKENIHERSTYETLHAALICMREHMRKHEIKKVAMPKICCGNDLLNWQRVKSIISKVFANEFNVEISICVSTSPKNITQKCDIIEVKGNVFTSPPNCSIVHTVSADSAICKGISIQYKCKFGNVVGGCSGGGGGVGVGGSDYHKQQTRHTGNVAVVKDNDHFIYNLLTKERAHEKCTYPALYYALVAMREHMLQNNVLKIAIPRLGCGIDRLEWLHVKKILEFVFGNDRVEIFVFFHEPLAVSEQTTFQHESSCRRSV